MNQNISNKVETTPMASPAVRKFALIMPWGRVGSNLISSALARTPRVRIENEPTTGIRTRGLAAGMTRGEIDVEQRRHLESFVASATPEDELLGLKLSYESLVDRTAYIEQLAKHQFQIVLLGRRNFLKCAVSQQRAIARARQKTAQNETPWASPWVVKHKEPKPGAALLDIDVTIRNAATFEALHYEMLGRIQAIFGGAFDYFEYESILVDTEGTIRKVLDTLNLPQPKDVDIKHRKATSDALKDDVVNYEDLAKAARDNGMGRHL